MVFTLYGKKPVNYNIYIFNNNIPGNIIHQSTCCHLKILNLNDLNMQNLKLLLGNGGQFKLVAKKFTYIA